MYLVCLRVVCDRWDFSVVEVVANVVAEFDELLVSDKSEEFT